MKRKTLLSIAAPIAFVLAAAPTLFSDNYDKKTDITIDQPIQVPGAVLQPGTYTFILMDVTGNRHVVEIKSTDGKTLYATTFTTAAQRIRPTSKVVLTFYETPQGTPNAVRQWFWPGEVDGQEFLYTHEQAAQLTAVSHQTVSELPTQEATAAAPAATAPSSGDVTAAVQAPSEPTDQQPSQQIAEQPVQAQPSVAGQAIQQDQVVAQAEPPADNSNSNQLLAQNNPPAQVNAPDPAPQSTADNSDNSAALPQTASNMPLVGLLGLASLTLAGMLRMARRGRA
jgi:hypothetical protein